MTEQELINYRSCLVCKVANFSYDKYINSLKIGSKCINIYKQNLEDATMLFDIFTHIVEDDTCITDDQINLIIDEIEKLTKVNC